MNTVTLENGRFYIRAEWSPQIIGDIRRLPGRRAELEPGVWSVPEEYASHIGEFADRNRLILVGVSRETISQSTKQEAVVDHNKGGFMVRCDFANKTMVSELSHIRGSTWFQPGKCWIIPSRMGLAMEWWAVKHGAAMTPAARIAVAYAHDEHARYVASSAKETDWQPSRKLGIELYDYQRAGVEYALSVGCRLIIGDEPGVGKTAQAMAIWNELQAFPAILVCPASLKVNWRREVQRALPTKTVEILRGRKGVERMVWADVIIVNYDILPQWVDVLPQPMSVTADESHRIKNPAIERTRAVIKLMSRVPDGVGARICMTGTPVPNRTNEIVSQLEAVGQIGKFGGVHGARKRWQGRGMELNQLMRSTCYVRRKKKDVWVDAPERSWADLYVEGDRKLMEEYRKAEADIVAYIGEKAHQAALACGETDEKAQGLAWRAAMRASSAEHLVAISQLKRLVARAAMPAVKDWARDFLDSGEKLGLFAWHTEIVDGMADEFHGVKVQGGMSEKARTLSVDRFQNDPQVKVFCGQIMAAGEGLTLTAASNAVLMEQPWNAAAMDQVLDRFHRRGQVNDVTGYVVLVEGTIGVDIQELIVRKQAEVEAVVDGKFDSSGLVGILPDLVVRLAERTMENN